MAELIEILSPSALKDLETLNKGLLETIKRVDQVGQSMGNITTPSASGGALKDLTAEYKKQEQIIQQLQKQITKLSQVKTQSNAKTSEEIVNQRALAQNSDRQARATSNLVGAYARLNAQYQIAEKRVLDLRASQTASNREIRQAQREFDALRAKIMQADNAVGRWNRSGERTLAGFKDLLGAFGVAGGVYMFAQLTTATIRLIKELQGLNLALEQVSETQAEYAQNLEFIQKTSEDFGLSVNDLTKQFTQFYVSAKDKISGEEIQGIFRSIAKAGATMGLSVQQQERAFLAINQMMSKGTVQAEELRGQLGEALPGAFGIMAKAIGVTEKELGDMLKAGEVAAADVLPKFAQALEKAYGIESITKVQTLQAETNRLSNAWTNLIKTIDSGDGPISKVLINAITLLKQAVNLTERITKGADARANDALKAGIEFGRQQHKEAMTNIQKELQSRMYSAEFIDAALKQKEKERAERVIKSNNEAIERFRRDNETLERAIENREGGFIGQGRNRSAYNRNIIQINRLKGEIVLMNKVLQGSESLYQKKTEKIEQNTNAVNQNTNATKNNNALKAEERQLLIGSVEWYEKQIATLRQQQKELSRSSAEYEKFNQEIDKFVFGIERITNQLKSKGIAEKQGIDITKESEQSLKEWGDQTERNAKLLKQLKDETDAFLQSVAVGSLGNLGMGSLEQFFDGTFDRLIAGAETFEEKFAVTFGAVADVAKETFALISQFSQENFDAQFRRLEQEKEVALLFAGESADARERIEEQYESKRRAIQRRQAEAQKRLAIFSIITDTAKGVAAALGTLNIPLSVIIGALGLARLAQVQSQQIPEFWKGTDNAPEGWAWTQEKGREIITDAKGKIKSVGSDNGRKLTYLSKGDKVYTNEETRNFERNLNSMLIGQQIEMPKTNFYGLTKEDLRVEVDRLLQKDSVFINVDKNGLNTFVQNGNTRKILLNNHLRLQGRNV